MDNLDRKFVSLYSGQKFLINSEIAKGSIFKVSDAQEKEVEQEVLKVRTAHFQEGLKEPPPLSLVDRIKQICCVDDPIKARTTKLARRLRRRELLIGKRIDKLRSDVLSMEIESLKNRERLLATGVVFSTVKIDRREAVETWFRISRKKEGK